MSRNETPIGERRCTAPVEGGCGQPYYAAGYCEGHARRKRRAEDANRVPNLTKPVRPRSSEKTQGVSGRISESSHAYYLAHKDGEYAAVSSVLEQHARQKIKRMTPEDRAAMAAHAIDVLARREQERTQRSSGRAPKSTRKKKG